MQAKKKVGGDASFEYMLANSQNYKKVICCVSMGDRLSNYFNITEEVVI